MILLLITFISICRSLPLTKTLNVLFDGTWTVSDPLKSTYYYLTIHEVANEDFYIGKFNKPPPCFSQFYKINFNNLFVNITTISNQFVTAIRFVNFKNTLVGKSIMIVCGNVTEYTFTILRSNSPTFTISHRSTVNITRGFVVGTKHNIPIPKHSFLQQHFLSILVTCFFIFIIFSHFLSEFPGN
ncbi:hypothetical protein CL6EHI_093940 [Entamoeba histolytica]|uniref:Uncharacterized protein n=1 Tax=Entamoeba histolytica TaxID=5759 RepID=A0A175JKB6_ENTHI|nr:hypothetical protein CL6EHI_093940 [Entamoeba histolytica]